MQHPIHPSAELLPEMSDEDFSRLCADIQENGLVESIKLWNKQVIDGRHRLKACNLIGVTPRFENMDHLSEDQVVDYIRSLNLSRRHLNNREIASVAAVFAARSRGKLKPTKLSETLLQKADLVAPQEPLGPTGPKPVSIEKAAEIFNVPERSVKRATQKLIQSGDIEPTRKRKETAAKKPDFSACFSSLDAAISKLSNEVNARSACEEAMTRLRLWLE